MRSEGISSRQPANSEFSRTNGTIRNPSQLLRDLTDLFVSRQEPSNMAILQYEDIASRLAKQADAPARAYVAARISTHRQAPVLLIDALLQSDPTCAKILVEHCNRVSPKFLLHYAGHEDPAFAAAVARRRRLSPALALALAGRPETQILRDLAANPQVELQGALLDRLVAAAKDDVSLAKIVTARANDCLRLAPLFLAADAEQRLRIISEAERQNFPAEKFNNIRLAGPSLIKWLLKRDPLTSQSRISAELARIVQQPPEVIAALLRDRSGDGLAVLFAAAGIPAPEAVFFLLRCQPEISHSCERIRSLAKVIETMPAHAARWLIGTIAGLEAPTSEKKSAVYQPLHDIAARPQSELRGQQPVRQRQSHRIPAKRSTSTAVA